MNRAFVLFAAGASALAACTGDIGGDSASSGSGSGSSGAGGAACSPNDAIMKGLAPTCAGCHAQGTAPFFASLAAFEDMIAYEPKYVVPGKPDESRLVALLEGTATGGSYKQMPLTGDPFAKLAADGKTSLTMADVRAWITGLVARPKSDTPNPKAVTVQRLSDVQIVSALQAQLGLTQDDFFHPAAPITFGTLQRSSLGEDNYPVYSSDWAPGPFEGEPVDRDAALGAAQTLRTRKRDLAASPPFADAFIPIAQRWCRMAIDKPSNKLLFPNVDPKAPSQAAAADIKKNIAFWHLHFLGEPSTQAAVDDVFKSVFAPLEAANDTETAWTGVCSYFVRHPKWIFY